MFGFRLGVQSFAVLPGGLHSDIPMVARCQSSGKKKPGAQLGPWGFKLPHGLARLAGKDQEDGKWKACFKHENLTT